MNKIINQVKELAIIHANKLELEILEVEWVNEFGTNILRIIADAPGSLNIDQATALNEAISLDLDKLDLIEDEYMLEVSSPGAEMPLRDRNEVLENVGQYININTGDKVYEGTMLSFENDIVVIRVNLKGRFKNFEVPYDNIKKIRLAVKF